MAQFEAGSDEQRQLIELIGRIVEPVFLEAIQRANAPIEVLDDLRRDFFAECVYPG